MQFFILDWQTRIHANGDVQKVLFKKKENVSEERGSKRRKGGLVWNSPCLYHQNGTIKKHGGGEREEEMAS